MNNHPLTIGLDAAVPLHIIALRHRPWAEMEQMAKEAAEVLERNGEAILYRTKPGKSAESFNALARAIAILSFCPHGVEVFGRRWVAAEILSQFPE